MIQLGKDHPQVVVCLRIVGLDGNSVAQRLARFIPVSLLPVRVAQVFEGDEVIRTQAQRLLKVLRGFRHASFPRGKQAEIVPGVGRSIRVTGGQLEGTLETLTRRSVLFLLQVDASQTIEGLGALWIVAQSLLEGGFRLIEVAALEVNRTERQVVVAKLGNVGDPGERQGFRQPVLRGLRDLPDVLFQVV